MMMGEIIPRAINVRSEYGFQREGKSRRTLLKLIARCSIRSHNRMGGEGRDIAA